MGMQLDCPSIIAKMRSKVKQKKAAFSGRKARLLRKHRAPEGKCPPEATAGQCGRLRYSRANAAGPRSTAAQIAAVTSPDNEPVFSRSRLSEAPGPPRGCASALSPSCSACKAADESSFPDSGCCASSPSGAAPVSAAASAFGLSKRPACSLGPPVFIVPITLRSSAEASISASLLRCSASVERIVPSSCP